MTATRAPFKPVTSEVPCKVCNGNHKCSISGDGLILCGRRSGEQPGFRHLGVCEKNATWSQYREVSATPDYQTPPSTNGHHKPPNYWKDTAQEFARHLDDDKVSELADTLGVTVAAIQGIKGLGYSPLAQHRDMTGGCFTFPEVDGQGKIIGINCRYADGTKKAIAGSQRGVTVADGWQTQPGPLLLPEGASDVLALVSVGLVPIGRPSNMAGVEHLASMLRDVPHDRSIIVIGENDQKPNGDWPGRDGARNTAERLTEKLGRPVQWAMTPDGAKDCRSWLRERFADPSDAQSLGQELVQKLQAKVEPPKFTPNAFAFRWMPVNSALFAKNDYRPNWLVVGALVDGQPAIIGGPQKSLKTSIGCVDLGISLASATPWLGKFAVLARRRVCICSGESGPWTLQETAKRICNARNIALEDLGDWLFWQFRLPQLSVNEQLEAMRVGLERDKIEVLLIDPLYLCLLAGSTDLAASNLFDVGPLLLRIAQLCQSLNVTVIFNHHTTKPSARKYEPLDLTDLAFSGTSEFARQWVLLSRREAYESGSGHHALWMAVGGSCGHGGQFAVTIEEGQLADDFSGRTWEVVVQNAGEARQEEKKSATDARAEQKRQRDGDDEQNLIAALDQLGGVGKAISYGRCRSLSGLSKDRMSAAVERLLAVKRIRETTIKIKIGSGAKRDSKALVRRSDDDH